MGNLIGSNESENIPFNRETLVQGIKEKRFKKVVFLTGAGISVASGIPDFRTPGTGLYSKVQSLNLPHPEALFSIDYFKERPEAFYSFAKAYIDLLDAKPVLAHHFIKIFNDEKILHRSYTQNVDGLELEAGLPAGKLIEAHGHLRSATCISCKKAKDMEECKKALREGELLRCKCGGLIKPDVTFFGESLPMSFYLNIFRIKQCDLAIVMGTSLTVFPFASLIGMVPKSVPMVLINNENSVNVDRDKFLFLGGNIEEIVAGLIKDLGWEEKIPQELKSKL